MRISIAFLLAAAFNAPAQIVSFGVKAGVPGTTAPFEHVLPGHHSDTGRWSAGPTVEFHITHALSAEINALYRSYDVSGFGRFLPHPDPSGQFVPPPGTGPVSYSVLHSVRAWDFPVLLKYRFMNGPARPFVSGGISLTHESADLTITCTGACAPWAFEVPVSSGISKVNANRRGDVVAGGVEFKYGKLTIAPELRYSRLIQPGGNQTVLLLGLTF